MFKKLIDCIWVNLINYTMNNIEYKDINVMHLFGSLLHFHRWAHFIVKFESAQKYHKKQSFCLEHVVLKKDGCFIFPEFLLIIVNFIIWSYITGLLNQFIFGSVEVSLRFRDFPLIIESILNIDNLFKIKKCELWVHD